MRLIFNSDVLYQSQLITGELPSSLQKLLHVCCESGITVSQHIALGRLLHQKAIE